MRKSKLELLHFYYDISKKPLNYGFFGEYQELLFMENRISNPSGEKITALYAIGFALYYASFASVRCFISSLLVEAGFSYVQIGVITFCHMLSSACIQPVLPVIVDRMIKTTHKKTVLCCSFLSILISIVMIYAPKVFLVYILAYIFLGFFETGLAGMMISLGMEYENSVPDFNFGITRAAGSAGYGISSVLFGLIFRQFDTRCIWIGNFLLIICMIGVLGMIPEMRQQHRKPTEIISSAKAEAADGIKDFCKKNKWFCVFLGTNIFIFFGHCIQNTYLPEIVGQFNAEEDVVGILIGIASVMEIIPMFFSNRINKFIAPSSVLSVSALGFILKSVVTASAGNMKLLVLASILQITGYALFPVSCAFFINNAISNNNRATAQGFVLAANECGFTIAGLVGGLFLEFYSINALLWVSACVTAIGGTILITVIRVVSIHD